MKLIVRRTCLRPRAHACIGAEQQREKSFHIFTFLFVGIEREISVPNFVHQNLKIPKLQSNFTNGINVNFMKLHETS